MLVTRAAAAGVALDLVNPEEYEPEDLPKESLALFLMSTYQGGTPPRNATYLCKWLEESSVDFRVGRTHLAGLRYAVFGLGNRLYEGHFNAIGRRVDSQLALMGGRRLTPMAVGCEDQGTIEEAFDAWQAAVLAALMPHGGQGSGGGAAVGGVKVAADGDGGSDVEEEKEEEDLGEEEEEEEGENSKGEKEGRADALVDLEDVAGKFVPRKKKGNGSSCGESAGAAPQSPKAMVTPLVHKSLTKQGYKVIGTHSGVKLCRWTKSQLRGRGGCYKHSFYGIESHRCMEATPSLACANKCVFCWRHHSNPVGTSWKWKMDPPDMIVEGAISAHARMVNEMRGVPGVKSDRLAEGMTPRHCALSLVGEPIMYPRINELLGQLHARRISSFLVTNAQFPQQLRDLAPTTQLYVSVDAATKESLKAIDRPLFRDFWERFQECLSLIRIKRQRTVYRLTLVAGYNMEELAAYAELLKLGDPDFIEIKGVTYCGSSDASDLTMKNVPYHADVKRFGEALADAAGGMYGLACEHEHSCCILLARKDRFLVDGKWHTWIDYERFQDLVAAGKEFTSEDYRMETPAWAVWGATEAGFDPNQERFKKVRLHGGDSNRGTPQPTVD
eukprot:jgi/Mesvir1/18017/Mv09347-RA.2